MSLIPCRVDRLSNTKKFHLISKKSSLTDVWVRTCVKSIFSNRRIVKPFSICYSSTQQIQEHKNDLLLFFFKEKCHNRSIWQVNQIENKRIQSFWSTIILVLDSITSVLNFVNRIKANFMEKLGFPDIKSVSRRGEKCGVESPHAQSFNLFVLLTCASNDWASCVGIENSGTK